MNDFTGKKVLVTGGAGFIGSTLVKALVAKGCVVRVLDNFSSGYQSNLTALKGKVEMIEGDIRNSIACRNACRGIEIVFHLAAFVSAPKSVVDPVSSDAVNIGGMLNMLTAARDCKVRRFVFSSSSAIYGDAEKLPIKENSLPRPASPYGIQKLYGEHLCRIFSELHGLETTSLRYFNVFGPGQRPDSDYAAVIPRFVSRLTENLPVTIYGDGLQSRDFLSVHDVVRANLLSASVNHPGGICLNIAGGKETTLLDLHGMISEVLGVEVPPFHEAARQGDVRRSVAHIGAAGKIIGFRPKVSLADGLRETVATFQNLSGGRIDP